MEKHKNLSLVLKEELKKLIDKLPESSSDIEESVTIPHMEHIKKSINESVESLTEFKKINSEIQNHGSHIYKGKEFSNTELIPGDVVSLVNSIGTDLGIEPIAHSSNGTLLDIIMDPYTSYKKFPSPKKDFSFYIDHRGILWGEGRNDMYQLGIDNQGNLSKPVQITDVTGWDSVYTSESLTIGKVETKDGSNTYFKLYVWGSYTCPESDEIVQIKTPTLIPTIVDDSVRDDKERKRLYYVNDNDDVLGYNHVRVMSNDHNGFVISATGGSFSQSEYPIISHYGADTRDIKKMCDEFNLNRVSLIKDKEYLTIKVNASENLFMVTVYHNTHHSSKPNETKLNVYVSGSTPEDRDKIVTDWTELLDDGGFNSPHEISSRIVLIKDTVVGLVRNVSDVKVQSMLYNPHNRTRDMIERYLITELQIKDQQDRNFSKPTMLGVPYRDWDLVVYIGKIHGYTEENFFKDQHLIFIHHGLNEAKGTYKTENVLALIPATSLNKLVRDGRVDSQDYFEHGEVDPFISTLNSLRLKKYDKTSGLWSKHLTFDQIMELYYGNNPTIRWNLEYINDYFEEKTGEDRVSASFKQMVEDTNIIQSEISGDIKWISENAQEHVREMGKVEEKTLSHHSVESLGDNV